MFIYFNKDSYFIKQDCLSNRPFFFNPRQRNPNLLRDLVIEPYASNRNEIHVPIIIVQHEVEQPYLNNNIR